MGILSKIRSALCCGNNAVADNVIQVRPQSGATRNGINVKEIPTSIANDNVDGLSVIPEADITDDADVNAVANAIKFSSRYPNIRSAALGFTTAPVNYDFAKKVTIAPVVIDIISKVEVKTEVKEVLVERVKPTPTTSKKPPHARVRVFNDKVDNEFVAEAPKKTRSKWNIPYDPPTKPVAFGSHIPDGVSIELIDASRGLIRTPKGTLKDLSITTDNGSVKGLL